MDIPIRFPDNTEVIAQDVARFRALSPDDRVRTLGELFRVYRFLAERSAKPDAITRLALRRKSAAGRQSRNSSSAMAENDLLEVVRRIAVVFGAGRSATP